MSELLLGYRVTHATRYRYASAVSLSRQLVHLRPRDCAWQRCVAHRLEVEPVPVQRVAREDAFGNGIAQLTIDSPHRELHVVAESRVELRPHLPAELPVSLSWEEVRRRLAAPGVPTSLEALRYRFESPFVPLGSEFSAYAAVDFLPGRPLLEAVQSLMSRIHAEFRYDAEATSVATPVLEVLRDKHGVCQDFAHLMIACLRSLGLAARYVSGYLLTRPPPGQPRLIGADASHAWVSVFCPQATGGGFWVDFDPTNNLLPDAQHILLGWGRDFGDVSPLRGVILGGGAHEIEVAVTVAPETDYPQEEMPYAV